MPQVPPTKTHAGLEPLEEGTSLWRDAWLRLRKNRLAVGSGLFLAVLALLAVFGPMISSQSSTAQNLGLGATAPSLKHWFGTDLFGRDLFVRALEGGRVSLAVGAEPARLAIVFGRTCLFIVNFGFWIGSLWGDPLRTAKQRASGWEAVVPDWFFAIAWALALIAAGVWGVRENRRAVVNIAAVFGAIHFYTQYFARLGASPGSVLAAGLTMSASFSSRPAVSARRAAPCSRTPTSSPMWSNATRT